MGQTIVQVDAFTDCPFGGNPAAVCVAEAPRDERWMQAVAREMNLSETSFLHPEVDDRGPAYRLRWFTPTVEVDLCGHATLAAAHVLWSEGHLPADTPARFLTRGGPLVATRRGGWIELDFPETPVLADRPADPSTFARILGTPVVAAGYSRYDALVELASEEAVRGARPDIPAVAALPVRGLIVTGPASAPGFDFVSRFFAPAVGVDEDPVCGSAHCCLGPYWGEKLGKSDLVAYQASPRGGVLRVGLGGGGRVRLGGQAVTVLRGELTDAPA
jgi:predicted PhzF superfamily epimerase YddE/YHI9